MHKIVLIEKYSESSLFWPYLLKSIKVTGLSVQEVVTMYQGFEGELLCMSEINEDRFSLDQVVDEILKINKANDLSLLHIISNNTNLPVPIAGAFKCGYDVGICERDKTIYSSIFNEILFGHLPELIVYIKYLNENLLFPSRALAEKYIDMHQQLSIQGKGVEDYEEMIIYEIWKERGYY